jgi:hypothetical protein
VPSPSQNQEQFQPERLRQANYFFDGSYYEKKPRTPGIAPGKARL